MNRVKLVSILLVVTLALSACGKAAETPDPTQTLAAVYTAAAVTMTAQAALFTATPLPLPTNTNTPEPTRTPEVTNTPAGAVLPPVIGPGATGDLSAWMSDITVPDGSVMEAGKAFTKTWQVYNKGTTTWTTGYKLVFVSGESMSGVSTAITAEVKPNTSANVSVNLVAPTTAGTKKGFWRLQNGAGSFFGDQLYVEIIVGGTPGTAGPTATLGTPASPTSTATAIVWVESMIEAGDTCNALAESYNITKQQLIDKNLEAYPNLCDDLKADTKVGEVIWVPGN